MQLALGKDLLINFLKALSYLANLSYLGEASSCAKLLGGRRENRTERTERHTQWTLHELECFLIFIIKIKPVELH